MMDMEYNRTSPFISNCLHYSSEFHPYVGEFLYLCLGVMQASNSPSVQLDEGRSPRQPACSTGRTKENAHLK